MPEIVKEILVKAPLEDTWALVSDMERFSLCIPGCKKVTKLSETEFDWDLETKVLRTTRKAKAKTRAVVMEAPTHSEFEGEGRLFERSNHYKLTIKGTTDLEPVDGGKTKIKFAGDVKASGVGGAIIEKVASGQMDDLFKEFEANIKQTLGDTGEETADDEGTIEDSAQAPTEGKSNTLVWIVIAAVVATGAYLLINNT